MALILVNLVNLVNFYIPVKITAVQKLQQYFPYYCNIPFHIIATYNNIDNVVRDTKCAISIVIVLKLSLSTLE